MFNFWPFNVARKRREEAHRQAQERLIAAFREDCQQRAAAHAADIEARLVARMSELVIARAKRNKATPMDDPRHPRNLSPQQRADRIAAMRPELGMVYQGSHSGPVYSIPTRDNPPKQPTPMQPLSAGDTTWLLRTMDSAYDRHQHSDERRMEVPPAEAVALVQQFRCTHPAISEFWQEQQARCDSPTDTGSPSCDAPPSND